MADVEPWGGPQALKEAERMDVLRSALRSAAATPCPILIAVDPEVEPGQLIIQWPVPDRLIDPELLFGIPTETRAIIASHDDLAHVVLKEAKAAGVQVIEAGVNAHPS